MNPIIESFDYQMHDPYEDCRPSDFDEDKTCPECKGEGSFEDLSDCCAEKRYPDVMLCSYCHDFCGPLECDDCKGTGKIQ